MTEFQRQCLACIRQFVELKVLDKTGRRIDPKFGPETGNMAHGAGLAIAWLATAAEPPHPLARELRGLARRLADLWARFLIDRSGPGEMPPDFDLLGFAQAVELLSASAPAGHVKLWRKALATAADATAHFLLKKRAAWGKPGPYTGTGPNHLFLFAGSLYRYGRLLGEPRHWRLATTAMRKLCQLQSPEGYFPENVGPAVGYQRVSLFGLCDYYAASGDQRVRPHVERGVGFVLRALYPDLSRIETIDQRNRGHAPPGRIGQEVCHWSLGFGWTPAGRRLARVMLARLADRLQRRPAEVRGSDIGMAAMGGLAEGPQSRLIGIGDPDRSGPVAALLPCERPAYTDNLDGQAAIVRRDGWCVVLSGYYASGRQGNPFVLDRTANLSVFHDRVGLIVGGGNDKSKLDAATFELVESSYVWYFPPIGGRARAAGRQGAVELDYGAAKARLVATVRSPRQLDLLAGAATNFAGQTNRFNLQLPVGPGTRLVIDGRPIRLNGKSERQSRWPVRRRLELSGLFRIELPGGGEFCWPHLPWSSYNIPAHTSPIAAAVGYLRLPLSGGKLDERRVRILVPG